MSSSVVLITSKIARAPTGGLTTSVPMTKDEFVSCIESFDAFGNTTRFEELKWSSGDRSGMTKKAFNEYWTSAQRQAHSLHEVSYRACFKPQLPGFFISRLTDHGDAVYDPFMGRGTTMRWGPTLRCWVSGFTPSMAPMHRPEQST